MARIYRAVILEAATERAVYLPWTPGSIYKPTKFSMSAKWLHMASWILIIVGALNWGLVGLGGFMGSNWNLVNLLLGSWPQVEWLVYILVGLSAAYEVVMHKKNCKMCGGEGMAM